MEMLIMGVVALAAFAAVLLPLFRRRPGVGDDAEFENIPPASSATAPPESSQGATHGDDDVESEVMRYREAVRAGTVCRKCGQANPGGSAYCFECGARLPLADAKEFE
jgi:ribosomal protein L40E